MTKAIKFFLKYFCTALIIILFYTCASEKNENFYLEHFKSKEQDFEVIKNYLLDYYGKDSSNLNKTRLIFVNPKVEKATMKIEIIDSNLIKLMEKINIASINLEKEDPSCDSSIFFDKIYFRYNKNTYYPVVNYVYDRCDVDSINYKSSTVTTKSILNHWQIVIDSNYP